jgi:ankyrin repeat protein
MLRENPALLARRTGRGEYGEKPPSSHHIYFWTIGEARSPLDTAAQFEQRETLETMLEFATPLQRLHSACRLGDESLARSLLRENPEMTQTMSEDDHRAVADAAWHGDTRAVELMVELGFDPGVPGHDSGTALHCAAWNGSADTVAALLRHQEGRALVATRDAHYGATPLGWCCHGSRFGNTARDHAGVARLLLEAGARPGPDTRDASRRVEAVLAAWPRGA